jgi:hypothetical protein
VGRWVVLDLRETFVKNYILKSVAALYFQKEDGGERPMLRGFWSSSGVDRLILESCGGKKPPSLAKYLSQSCLQDIALR